MQSFLHLLLLWVLAVSQAFVASPGALVASSNRCTTSSFSRSLNQHIRPATEVFKLNAVSEYWEGDWVCADCGYIYDERECGGVKFEDQPRGFICPQCRGPRRRYAKKVGNKVGVTLDGGDGPILFASFFGFAVTIAFGVWFANQ